MLLLGRTNGITFPARNCPQTLMEAAEVDHCRRRRRRRFPRLFYFAYIGEYIYIYIARRVMSGHRYQSTVLISRRPGNLRFLVVARTCSRRASFSLSPLLPPRYRRYRREFQQRRKFDIRDQSRKTWSSNDAHSSGTNRNEFPELIHVSRFIYYRFACTVRARKRDANPLLIFYSEEPARLNQLNSRLGANNCLSWLSKSAEFLRHINQKFAETSEQFICPYNQVMYLILNGFLDTDWITLET